MPEPSGSRVLPLPPEYLGKGHLEKLAKSQLNQRRRSKTEIGLAKQLKASGLAIKRLTWDDSVK